MARKYMPGDWVAEKNAPLNQPAIARIKDVYDDEPLFDLIMYAADGTKLGRVSPAMGGPRGFEPACSVELYVAIAQPSFPLPRYEWGRRLKYLDSATVPSIDEG